MIPKKIHYVWVGGKELPKDIRKCMASWSKYLPDYEIKEWNETNFDIHAHPFVQKAYEARKWAFVSDYIRAWALYHEGGIYLDTDNMVVSNFDDLLENRAFVGFETPDYPFTACFGAEKGHPFLKKILDSYDGVEFAFDANDQFANVNTKTVSNILINDYQCKLGNMEQSLGDGIHVYPMEILCNPSSTSRVIHIFNGSWMEGETPLKKKLCKFLKLRIHDQKSAERYQKFLKK